jgi:hypothetical protein
MRALRKNSSAGGEHDLDICERSAASPKASGAEDKARSAVTSFGLAAWNHWREGVCRLLATLGAEVEIAAARI